MYIKSQTSYSILNKSVSPFQSPSLSLVKTLHSLFIFTCSNLMSALSAFISFFRWIDLQSAIGAEGGGSSLWDNENRRCTCVCVCCHFSFTQHEQGKRAETKERHRERKNRESNERETPNEAERTERSLIQKKNYKLGSLYLNYLEKRVNTTHLFNNRIG